MNIIWTTNKTLNSSCGEHTIEVDPQDIWEGVKVLESKLNALRGMPTADINLNGKIFPNIPVSWYMIEN